MTELVLVPHSAIFRTKTTMFALNLKKVYFESNFIQFHDITPNEYLNAISLMALDPNRHTKGIKLLIVKFFTLLELFSEKTGCL